MGGYNIKDTYLSPLKYSMGMRIFNERMKMTRSSDYRISRQQFINVDFAFTRNPAETASSFAGFVDYSLGYHYHFQPQPALKLLAGASVRALGGFIYNTRNGNNPASAKVETDLNLSAMAIYKFQVNNYPFALLCYQIEILVAGVMFSPHYGQSYYEIFNLGNSEGVVLFSSLHNKFAMRNFLTADFPVGNFTIRAGYLNTFTKNGCERNSESCRFKFVPYRICQRVYCFWRQTFKAKPSVITVHTINLMKRNITYCLCLIVAFLTFVRESRRIYVVSAGKFRSALENHG